MGTQLPRLRAQRIFERKAHIDDGQRAVGLGPVKDVGGKRVPYAWLRATTASGTSAAAAAAITLGRDPPLAPLAHRPGIAEEIANALSHHGLEDNSLVIVDAGAAFRHHCSPLSWPASEAIPGRPEGPAPHRPRPPDRRRNGLAYGCGRK